MSRGGGARTSRPVQEPHRANPAVSPAVDGTPGSVRRARVEGEFRSAYASAGVAMARLTQQGRVIDVKSIQQLAALPSREEILSKVLFLIQASAQRLVTAIGGVGRNLAVVVDQGVKEGKFSE